MAGKVTRTLRLTVGFPSPMGLTPARRPGHAVRGGQWVEGPRRARGAVPCDLGHRPDPPPSPRATAGVCVCWGEFLPRSINISRIVTMRSGYLTYVARTTLRISGNLLGLIWPASPLMFYFLQYQSDEHYVTVFEIILFCALLLVVLPFPDGKKKADGGNKE
jgi:hypothetical protein